MGGAPVMGVVGAADGMAETGVMGTAGIGPVALVEIATPAPGTGATAVSGGRCTDAVGISGWRCTGGGDATAATGTELEGVGVATIGVSDGRCAADETAVPAAAVSGWACTGMDGGMMCTAVGDDKSDSLSAGCLCTGATAGIIAGCGAGGVGAGAAAALNAGVPAVSALGVDAAGGVTAVCGRETNRPNRCPMRPKSEDGVTGAAIGGGAVGADGDMADTAGSDTETPVSARDDTASAGANCTDGRAGSSLCR